MSNREQQIRESWRDDYDFLKKAAKDLLPILKKIGFRSPRDEKVYNRFKNSYDRTEEEDEMLYNWSKKYSEKLKERIKDGEIDNIPNEVFFPLMKEYEMEDLDVINDIIRRKEVIEFQVEQNVSEKVGKKLEAKLGKDITNKIAEYFEGRGVEPGYPGFEKIEYDKFGKRRKFRWKMKYGEPRFEPTYIPDSDDEEMERRIKLRNDRTEASIAGIQARGKGKVSSDLINLMGEFIGSKVSGWNMDMAKSLAKQNITGSSLANQNTTGSSSSSSSSSSSISSGEMMRLINQKRKEKQRAEAYRTALMARRKFQRNPSLKHHQRAIAKEVGLITGLPKGITGLVGEMAGDPEIRLKTVPEGSRKVPQAKNALFKILEDAGADPEYFQQTILEDGNYTSRGRPVTKLSQLTDKVVLDILNDYEGEDLKILIDPDISDDNPEFLELKALRERLIEKPIVKKQQKEEGEERRRQEEEMRREEEAPKIEKEMVRQAVRESMGDVEGGYEFYSTSDEDVERVKVDLEDLFQPMVVGLKPERLTQEEILEKLKNIDSNKMSEVSDLDSDLENVLSRGNMGRPLPQPRDPLADPVLRRVNQNTAFLSNDIVPPAYEMNREGIVREGEEMKRDPDPRVEPRQPLLVQDLMLEGDANRDRQIERIANSNIGGNNMMNMEQNYFLRAANAVRRRQVRVMGEPDDEEYDVEEKDELEFGDDMLDRTPFDEDDEGLSNRELIKRQLDRLNYGKKGKWSGMDPKSSEDWRRITSERAKENQLLTGSGVNYLRGKEIPWKHPTRTFSNNYVNLIRNSNRSMTLAMGEFLP